MSSSHGHVLNAIENLPAPMGGAGIGAGRKTTVSKSAFSIERRTGTLPNIGDVVDG